MLGSSGIRPWSPRKCQHQLIKGAAWTLAGPGSWWELSEPLSHTTACVPYFSHRVAAAPQPWPGLAEGLSLLLSAWSPIVSQEGAPGSALGPETEGEVYSLVQSTHGFSKIITGC